MINPKLINKVNRIFDLAVTFFLFSGSLYFIYYSLSAGKLIYILLSLLVYFVSLSFRSLITKRKNYSGFTEAGIFFISPLFLAYLMALLNLDNNVRNYLPDKLLAGSWTSFVFLIIILLISPQKKDTFKFVNILLLLIVLVLYSNFNGVINDFFQSIPRLSEFVIGTPLVYLLMVLLGLKNNANAKFET